LYAFVAHDGEMGLRALHSAVEAVTSL